MLQDKAPPTPVFPLFSNGKKNAQNCRKFPLTCSLLQSFPEATSCKHGEVKFILVPPDAHVPPHMGPTNTRLEVVAGLSLGEGELRVRVAEETRFVVGGGGRREGEWGVGSREGGVGRGEWGVGSGEGGVGSGEGGRGRVVLISWDSALVSVS